MRRIAFILTFLLVAIPSFCNEGGQIRELIRKGDALVKSGDYPTAIIYYTELSRHYQAGVRDTAMAHGLRYGGNCCAQSNRFVEALRFYTLAIECAQHFGNAHEVLACTVNIGSIYAYFGDSERAIVYFEDAFDEAAEQKNAYLMSILASNLVSLYCKTQKVDKAREYLALQMRYPMEDKRDNQLHVLLNQGLVAQAERQYSMADYYFRQARNTVESHHMGDAKEASVLYEMGNNAALRGNLQEAELHYKTAVSKAGDADRDVLYECYEALSRLYTRMGKADSASVYKMRYVELSDSLFNQQQFNQAKNSLLSYERRVNRDYISRLKASLWALGGFVVVVIIILSIVFYYTRKLRQSQRLLVGRNEELIRQNDAARQLREADKRKIQETRAENERLLHQLGDMGVTAPPSQAVTSTLAAMPEKEEESLTSTATTGNIPLSDQRKAELLNNILEVMDDLTIISDPDFTIAMLAKRLQSNTRYVSAVINEHYHKNFKTFLNEFRIREACRRLADDDHYGNLTIAAIAETVGFKSLNGFVLAFKKMMGMTPSLYKRISKGDAYTDSQDTSA